MALRVLVDKYLLTIKPQWQGARPEQAAVQRGDDPTDLFKASILGYDRELDRAQKLGAVGDDDALDRAIEASTPGTLTALPSHITDADLGKMKAEELVAFANQYPESVPRIVALERESRRPRSSVLALDPDSNPGREVPTTRDPAGEQTAAELAERRRQEANERAALAAAQAEAAQAAAGAGKR